ncbi:MAG: hypothetical protein NTV48_00200 [Candidatus Vogelbacteria bacterium]|nr:hypothetical protein [Candidatus Vogelbacteria bacterium]
MKDNRKKEQEVNLAVMTIETFIQYYNKNIPASFPRATTKALEQFQVSHANLFDDNKFWTIDKHRRRLMDWLILYREAT